MSHSGFLTVQGGGSTAEARAQLEDDLRRWADDGGLPPESDPARPKAAPPEPTPRAGLPNRSVYRRGTSGVAALACPG